MAGHVMDPRLSVYLMTLLLPVFYISTVNYKNAQKRRGLRRRIQRLSSRKSDREVLSDNVATQEQRQHAGTAGKSNVGDVDRRNKPLIVTSRPGSGFQRNHADLRWIVMVVLGVTLTVLVLKLAIGMATLPFLLVDILAVIAVLAIAALIGRRRREAKFVAELPEFAEMVARGVRAGLPLVEAMYHAGLELRNTAGSALLDAASNVRLGMSFDEALSMVEKKWKLQELSYLRSAISLHYEVGGNITNILFNIALGMRARNLLQRKIRVLSSEAKTSALIMTALPFVVTFILFGVRPGYMRVLIEDPHGKYVLATSLLGIIMGCAMTMMMARIKD